jgi:hypothetical protein
MNLNAAWQAIAWQLAYHCMSQRPTPVTDREYLTADLSPRWVQDSRNSL